MSTYIMYVYTLTKKGFKKYYLIRRKSKKKNPFSFIVN